jgi:hypothetical protein
VKKNICLKYNTGIYFDDDRINGAIVLYQNTFQSFSHYSEDEYERMNPTLRANTKALLYEAEISLQKHLGRDNFCECLQNKIIKGISMNSYNTIKNSDM